MISAQSAQPTPRKRRRRLLSPSPGKVCDPRLQAFYEEWFLPLVRRAAWRHNLSREDARDIVQDAFVLALQKLDMTKNPKMWLKHAVDNLALNLVRKGRRRTHLLRRWGAKPAKEPLQQEDE